MRTTSSVSNLFITISNTIGPETFSKSASTPALDLLFSRGYRTPTSYTSILNYSLKKLTEHQSNDVSVSALLARVDPEMFACPYYLCCELVEYTAGMNDVYAQRLNSFSSVSAQSERYSELLCEVFEKPIIRHVSTWPSLFILGLQDDPKIRTTSTNDAERRPMSDVLPKGPGSRFWISKMNEAQMVFHQNNEKLHDLEMSRRPNGVWLWGEGSRSTLINSPLTVSAQSPELLTLSHAAKATLTSHEHLFSTPLPKHDVLIELQLSQDPNSLIQANVLASRAITLLRTGRYSELNIQMMKNSVLYNTKCTKYSLRKFWKKTINTVDWLTDTND